MHYGLSNKKYPFHEKQLVKSDFERDSRIIFSTLVWNEKIK